MMARLDARTAYSHMASRCPCTVALAHATVLTAGIVANNASGMCCGVANNTYNTLDHMRLVFADGTLLDTADKDSCARFLKASKPEAISSRDQATKQL
jgi:D-lactate dehydrogenase